MVHVITKARKEATSKEAEEGESEMNYEVTVTVTVPDVEGDDADDAINFVTEAIEDAFAERVDFTNQRATAYGE